MFPWSLMRKASTAFSFTFYIFSNARTIHEYDLDSYSLLHCIWLGLLCSKWAYFWQGWYFGLTQTLCQGTVPHSCDIAGSLPVCIIFHKAQFLASNFT